MGVRDASRSRPVMCWKQSCGFSTQVRNGTCCRKAIRTTKLCIDAFKHGTATKFCAGFDGRCQRLRENGALDEKECFIDAAFVMAKGGGSEIGPTKRGKGMKIMAIVDRHGLPLWVSTHAANHHEVRLVQPCFDFSHVEAKPENMIGDRAYDSDPLDEALRTDGIEMIAPHRSNRSEPPAQDRRRLSRYKRRWLVEPSSPGYNGSVASSSAGSTTPITSSASSSSPASLSSSDDFEIGSSQRGSVCFRCRQVPSNTPSLLIMISLHAGYDIPFDERWFSKAWAAVGVCRPASWQAVHALLL